MPNYKGKRPGTRRIVLWTKGARREWVVQGTKADGDRFEAQRRLELRVEAGPAERRVAATFFELCEEYAVHAEAHLKASTWRVRTYQIDALTTHVGAVRVTEFGPGNVEAFKLARLRDKVMASSVNNELRVLKTVLGWGRDMGHQIPLFNWKRLPERGNPRARAFTAPELERLWASCRSEAPTLLPLLLFLVNTGCRKGEGIAAEWSWIDFDAAMIRIPSNAAWQPKNGKPREVPMSDSVRAILTGKRKDKRWVFPSFFGGALTEFPKDLWRRVTKHAKLTGGPHQLRHTFASHFLQQVPDLFLLAQVLGHSHHRVTELYAHLLPGHLDRARNAVNLAFQTVAATVVRAGRWSRK